MLMYKQGRFWTQGASFAIPDGFFLETAPQVQYRGGVNIWGPKKSCLYVWIVYEEQGETRENLRKIADDFEPISDVMPIAVNGLSGHGLIYSAGRKEYYEAHFVLPDERHLAFIAEGEGHKVQETLDTAEFKAVFESVRAEQTE